MTATVGVVVGTVVTTIVVMGVAGGSSVAAPAVTVQAAAEPGVAVPTVAESPVDVSTVARSTLARSAFPVPALDRSSLSRSALAVSSLDPRRPLLSATPLSGLPPVAVHELAYDAYELGGFEGLGEEGVDADGDTAVHLVLGAGADDGDRQMTGTRIGPQSLGGAQPVQPGHDDVEGDDIRLHLMHDIQTLGTIGRGHDLEALKLEIDPDQLPDHPVVIDNEHPTGHA